MKRVVRHIVNGTTAMLLVLLPGCGDGPVDPDIRESHARIQIRAWLTSLIRLPPIRC